MPADVLFSVASKPIVWLRTMLVNPAEVLVTPATTLA
jgi:hypothetical protein